MALDWSTFLLEVVNFLILVWILKRFLYAPVKAAIERRRERVESVLAEADARRAEADRLRADYEARQQQWEHERASARADLEQEMGAERARRLQELEQELGRRREREDTLDERRRDEAARRSEEAALTLAAGFAAKLLSRIADQALEARLLALAVEDLASLSEDHRQALVTAAREDPTAPRMLSAYALSDAQRAELESALSRAAETEVRCRFAEDPELIAGIRIDAGALVMRANLRDELRYFAEAAL
jgi:F-type H+-transporting ATPase subunit b